MIHRAIMLGLALLALRWWDLFAMMGIASIIASALAVVLLVWTSAQDRRRYPADRGRSWLDGLRRARWNGRRP